MKRYFLIVSLIGLSCNGQVKLSEASDFVNGYAIVEAPDDNGNTYSGYTRMIDSTGQFVTSKKFAKMRFFKEGLAVVKEKNSEDKDYIDKFGYMTKSGEYAITPRYNYANDFSEGLASVGIKSVFTKGKLKWGFIDYKGNYLIPAIYDDAGSFKNGIARVNLDGKWGYINKKGEEIIIPQFSEARDFNEGLALVKNSVDDYAYIDSQGNYVYRFSTAEPAIEIIKEKDLFPNPSDFNGGLALIFEQGVFKYIDRKGIVRISPPKRAGLTMEPGQGLKREEFIYRSAQHFENNLARVSIKDKGYNFINEKGKFLSKVMFQYAGDFSEGLAKVALNNKLGFINKNGEIVINKEILKPEGELITSPQFESITDFQEGLAVVKVRGKYGFINTNGNFVIKPQFLYASVFVNGKALIMPDPQIHRKRGYNYIDKTGKILFDFD